MENWSFLERIQTGFSLVQNPVHISFRNTARKALVLGSIVEFKGTMEKIVLSEHTLSGLIRDIEVSLLNRHVFRGDVITGQEIVKFAPHKQINSFILFQIYQDWNAHVQNFRHPYFDFDHEEVNEGLTRFLNMLSQHIQIKETDFRPLLEKAIYNTIKLILNPAEVFNKFFFMNHDQISINLFRKHAPYFSDYDFIIQSMLKFYGKNQIQVVEKQVFFEKMERVIAIFESREDNNIDKYRSYLFNKATGKELTSIQGTTPLSGSQPEFIPTRRKPVAPTSSPVPPPKSTGKSENMANSQPEKPSSGSSVAPSTPAVNEELTGQRKAETRGKQSDKEKEQQAEAEPKSPTPKAVVPPKAQPPAVEETKQPTTTADPEPVDQPASENVKPTPVENIDESKSKPIHQLLAERKQTKSNAPSLAERLNQEKAERRTLADSFQKKEVLNQTYSPELQTPEPEPVTTAESATLKSDAAPTTPDPAEIAASFIEEQEPPTSELPKSSTHETQGFDLFSQAPKKEKPASLFSEEAPKPTLGKQFQSEERPEALHESLAPQRAIKLEQIPVHKQFQFVQKLFGGQNVKFRVILDKINETQSYKEAEEVMGKYIFNTSNTRRSDKLSQEFIMLVKNRFEG